MASSIIVVVGIGSRLSRDDGIGLVLVEALIDDGTLPRDDALLLENADAATVASTLLELNCPLLLVDCADVGRLPGTHHLLDETMAQTKLATDTASTHGLGLADGLAIARELGFSEAVTIFAVQPYDLSPRPGLTPELTARLPKLLSALKDAYEMGCSIHAGNRGNP